jgi:hypothetical protein
VISELLKIQFPSILAGDHREREEGLPSSDFILTKFTSYWSLLSMITCCCIAVQFLSLFKFSFILS